MCSSSAPLGYEVWRYHVLYYCDPVSLIQLGWTCRGLRQLLNGTSTFVVDWQTACAYMQRECGCDRNLFYLDVPKVCDFLYAWCGDEVQSLYEVDLRLRQLGRSVTMHMMQPQMQWQRTPFLDPQHCHRALFEPGVNVVHVDEMVVPMPRMLDVPVELARCATRHYPRVPGETLEAFTHRQFWRNFHEVTTETLTTEKPSTGYMDPRLHTDLVRAYLERCAAEERDPYDPADDPELQGHAAGVWARTVMYSSAVGTQQFPMDLCLRREQVRTLGVDYLDRLFIPLRRYVSDGSLLEHRGPLYFTGLRYDNESGDFVNWALNTVALRHGMYLHLWLDCSFHFLHTLTAHIETLANSLETDLPLERLAARWRWIHHLKGCSGCLCHGHRSDPEQAERDQRAIAFVQQANYRVFHNVISTTVQRYTSHPCHESEWTPHYLTDLIPHYEHHSPDRRPAGTETQVVCALHHALEVASYLTEFSQTIGPRVGPLAEMYRDRTLRIYLSNGLGLLAFAPTWQIDYDWRPSRAHVKVSLRIPRIDLMQNHRVVQYMHFLNRRVLYYHPDPCVYLDAWQAREDIAKKMDHHVL